MSEELWLPIPGFEGRYEVSDMGRVRSIARTIKHQKDSRKKRLKGRILRPSKAGRGYLQVSLGSGNQEYVHALVLLAFVGPRPPGHECLHGDDDTTNNRLTNLEYGTPSKNMRDCSRRGRLKIKHAKGEAHGSTKLTEAAVREIRASLKSNAELGRIHNVHHNTVQSIRSGRTWRHVQ